MEEEEEQEKEEGRKSQDEELRGYTRSQGRGGEKGKAFKVERAAERTPNRLLEVT